MHEVVNMDVVIVVYCYSTLAWVKDADASRICKWFDSNKGVAEGQNDVTFHCAKGKVAGEYFFVRRGLQCRP